MILSIVLASDNIDAYGSAEYTNEIQRQINEGLSTAKDRALETQLLLMKIKKKIIRGDNRNYIHLFFPNNTSN